MAIDTSIYNNIRAPQIESPVNALAQVTQLKNAQNQNRLFDMRVAESEREQATQNALSEAWRNAYRPDGSLDEQGLIANLAQGGFGSKIPGIQKGLADSKKAGFDADSAKYESIIKNTDLVARTLAPALQNPALYPQLLAQLRQQTGGGQDMPEQFDPAIVQATIQKALSTKERAELEWKQKGYDLDVAKFGYQQSNDAANRGVTIRGQNMTDARARDNANQGKIPPGYRQRPDGNLEAIPGGPADIKAGELGAKREKSQQAAVAQADRVIKKVDQALSKVGWSTAGGPGKLLSGVPGTEAKNLETDLETIKANLGFAELQAMREASPTGGALGAIAVQELTALQATIASLDQAQSASQLKSRLGEIRTHYKNWKDAVTKGNSKVESAPSDGNVIDFGSLK